MDSPTLSLAQPSPVGVRPSFGLSIRYLPSLLILALSIFRVWGCHLNADDSWLLTVGEKWLAGGVPYVDIIETNPPASILLYMPAIIAGHWLGLQAEACVVVMMFAGVLASLALAAHILRRAELLSDASAPWWAAASLFLFLFLPDYVFAQREHIAAVLVLPVLATYASAMAGRPTPWATQLGAGLVGGICVAVKPYFGFALLLPLAVALFSMKDGWMQRLGLAFAPVNLLIAGIVGLYGVLAFAFFPAFSRDILPLVVALYLPLRLPVLILLGWVVKCALPAPYLLSRVIEPGRRLSPPLLMLVTASTGFALAMFIQGKAWPYHLYPTLTLAILALFGGLVEALLAARAKWFATGILASMLVCSVMTAYAQSLFSRVSYPPEVVEAVRKMGFVKPKILVICGDIALGHPLVREVGGEWVGRLSSQWISINASVMLADGRPLSQEERERLQSYIAYDRATLMQDIVERKPDLVLIEEVWWKSTAAKKPDIVAVLSDYEAAGTVDEIVILRRKAP